MYKLLGSKIRTLRKSLNLRQKDLCCDCLNKSTLCKIERNLMLPNLIQLNHIAIKLNVPISFLFQPYKKSTFYSSSKYFYTDVDDLFNMEKYLDILNLDMPLNFWGCFYKGMSYFRLDLKKDAEKLLCRCEALFSEINENDKLLNVENLCIALNALRKIKITSIKDPHNILYLNQILDYIHLYDCINCKIYYIVINNIGTYNIYTDNYNDAITTFENFLSSTANIIYTDIIASIYLNLSMAYFATKNNEKALTSVKNAIFFFSYLGNSTEACECYLNLFNYYLYSSNHSECLKIIYLLYDKFGDEHLIDTFKVLESILLYNMNDVNKLEKCIKKIKFNTLKNNSKIDYYFLTGKVNFFLGNTKVATTYYDKCKVYLKENKRYLDLSLLYKDLYEIFGDLQDLENHKKYELLSKNRIHNPIHPDITSPLCSQSFIMETY